MGSQWRTASEWINRAGAFAICGAQVLVVDFAETGQKETLPKETLEQFDLAVTDAAGAEFLAGTSPRFTRPWPPLLARELTSAVAWWPKRGGDPIPFELPPPLADAQPVVQHNP